jgi:hypothetical protein
VLPSEKVPVAKSCRVPLCATSGFEGVTLIEVSDAPVTVLTGVLPETPACVAVTVVLPVAIALSRPWLPPALLTTATAEAEEVQLTVVVRSWALPSEKVPVATSCNAVNAETDGVAGAIAMALKVADVTEIAVVPEMPLLKAVMVALPTLVPVRSPSLPSALLIFATASAEELHVTSVVMSLLVPSEKNPTAASCREVPAASDELGATIVIAFKVAAVTVALVDAKTPFTVAVIVAVPTPTPVSNPSLPATLQTVANSGAEEVQLTDVVRSCVVPSEKFPVAVRSTVVALGRDGFGGLIVIEVRVAAVTVIDVVPETPVWVAVIVAVPTRVAVTSPSLFAALLTTALAALDEVQLIDWVRAWVVLSEKCPVAVSC